MPKKHKVVVAIRTGRMDVFEMNASDGTGLKNLSNNPLHTGFTLWAWYGLGNPDWR